VFDGAHPTCVTGCPALMPVDIREERDAEGRGKLSWLKGTNLFILNIAILLKTIIDHFVFMLTLIKGSNCDTLFCNLKQRTVYIISIYFCAVQNRSLNFLSLLLSLYLLHRPVGIDTEAARGENVLFFLDSWNLNETDIYCIFIAGAK